MQAHKYVANIIKLFVSKHRNTQESINMTSEMPSHTFTTSNYILLEKKTITYNKK